MSNLKVKTRPVSTSVYPPSFVPDWVTEPQTMPEVIIRKKTQRHAVKPTIHYPESDGMPMAENTVQYKNLTNIEGNVSILYKDDPNVFIAGDLFWYPVEGRNDIKYAPDIMIVFDRPKKDRGSYKQWEEDNIAPQVIFEIWSPGNTQESKEKKFKFYDLYGVEEYYTYDPDKGEVEGWLRRNGKLQKISELNGWHSPRLGIQFRLERDLKNRKRMDLYYPDGRPFLSRIEEFEARTMAESKAQEEATARIEAESKAQEEATARIEAESKAQEEATARIEAESKAQEEATARIEAESKAQTEVIARIEAEAEKEREAVARAEAEAEKEREAAARAEAEAEAERTKDLLKAAMEQLQKAGISLPENAF